MESYRGNQVLAVLRHFPESKIKGQYVPDTIILPVNFEGGITNESKAYHQE